MVEGTEQSVFLWAVGRDERFREYGSEYEATLWVREQREETKWQRL